MIRRIKVNEFVHHCNNYNFEPVNFNISSCKVSDVYILCVIPVNIGYGKLSSRRKLYRMGP